MSAVIDSGGGLVTYHFPIKQSACATLQRTTFRGGIGEHMEGAKCSDDASTSVLL